LVKSINYFVLTSPKNVALCKKEDVYVVYLIDEYTKE
jgi:hypothetical protein